MIVFAFACAATSVALGAIYMFAAGAPRSYILINVAALAVGVITASLLRRVPMRNSRAVGALTIAIGLLMPATALFGVHLEGASRWISVAGISLQPSLILLPLAMILFAGDRGWLSSIGLVIAGIGLAMQPDRAMAGTLAAGLVALWCYRRQAPVTIALAVAVCAFTTTMVSVDAVAPVPFVEQVVRSAFAFTLLTGLAVSAGLAMMLAPAFAGFARTTQRPLFAVFAAAWLAVIVFAIIGNYPTPLVGYGSSTILGYCLSAAALRD